MPSPDWPAEAGAPGVWVKLLADAAAGIDAAHRAGLVHGRLTSDSFVLTADGVLKVVGFGEPPWLAGGVSLNYHLLATFRSSHETALDRFLEAHVSALLQQGLIELSCVARDGMRTRASAGTGSFRRAASIEETVAPLLV